MAKTNVPEGYIQKTYKIRLYPNNKQKTLFYQCAGTSRWAYNWALGIEQENYKNGGEFISDSDLRKRLTELKQTEEYKWLYDYSNNITKQAVKDACDAYKRFFKKQSNFPRFKSRKKSKPSFFNDGYKVKYKGTHIRIECIGWVKLAEKNRIPQDDYRITSLRVSKQGNHWFASINVVEKDYNNYSIPENQGIGIDLGLKAFAVCSDGKVYKNINKTAKVKKLEKRLKRLQKQVSRKYDMNKTEIEGRAGENRYKFIKTNNIRKLEYAIQSIRDKLNNIRTNYLHQVSNEIIKRKPIFIAIEDINVSGIMKNKHLARSIAEQNFYEFRRILTYKAKWNNIELRMVDRFFPSSKLCSCCGAIKKDLNLSDRVYKCECGNVIDRDYQASVNLSNSKIYEIA